MVAWGGMAGTLQLLCQAILAITAQGSYKIIKIRYTCTLAQIKFCPDYAFFVIFGCESSHISRDVRSSVSQLVSKCKIRLSKAK